ncbi:MAG: hypothetical protein U0441_17145 [Polyangiaceae bacterium]
MKMGWIVKGVLAAALLSGVALAAQGCGSASAAYCNNACECETCTDKSRQECVDYIENSRDNAVVAGCEARFDEVIGCLTGQSCKGSKIDETGCATEIGSMNGCADAYHTGRCQKFTDDLAAKYTECGIPVSGDPPAVDYCSLADAARADCQDACLPLVDCPCWAAPNGAGCPAKTKPYDDCIAACP